MNANRIIAALVLGFLLLLVAASGQAVPVTVNIEGTVDSFASELSGTFNTSQTMSASFTYESTTPADTSSATSASYPGAVTSLSFTIDGYGGTEAAFSRIRVDNGTHDVFVMDAGVTAPDIGDYRAFSFGSVFLQDNDGTAFNSTALPTSFPAVSEFEMADWELIFLRKDNTGGTSVFGFLTSLSASVAAVPEPTTILLLGLGLAGLGFTRRWQ